MVLFKSAKKRIGMKRALSVLYATEWNSVQKVLLEPAYGLIVISTHQQQSVAVHVLQEKIVQICLHFIVSGESM